MSAQREQILQALREAIHFAPDPIGEDLKISDLVLDSIDYVEIMVVLNTRFKVPLDPAGMTGIETVGGLVDYTLAHRGEVAEDSLLSGY